MNNLYIDYEQGITLGNDIQAKAQELNTLLKNISNDLEDLKPILNDNTDQEYLKQIEDQTLIMDKLVEAINQTGTFLINVSNAYNDVVTVNGD